MKRRSVSEFLARWLVWGPRVVPGKPHNQRLQTKKKWRDELQRYRTRKLDAPSWLWASIVELLISHEGNTSNIVGSKHWIQGCKNVFHCKCDILWRLKNKYAIRDRFLYE
jgi:hypothetical protein